MSTKGTYLHNVECDCEAEAGPLEPYCIWPDDRFRFSPTSNNHQSTQKAGWAKWQWVHCYSEQVRTWPHSNTHPNLLLWQLLQSITRVVTTTHSRLNRSPPRTLDKSTLECLSEGFARNNAPEHSPMEVRTTQSPVKNDWLLNSPGIIAPPSMQRCTHGKECIRPAPMATGRTSATERTWKNKV